MRKCDCGIFYRPLDHDYDREWYAKVCPDCERKEYKRERRMKKLKSLVERLGVRVALGKESIKHVDAILKRIAEQGYFPQVIDAVRRKN